MTRSKKKRRAEGYRHPEASALLRPEAGVQAQFRKKKQPATYRYDSSLSPALDWDGQNAAREEAEARIAALQGRIGELSAIFDPVAAETISESGISTAREQLAKAREDAATLKALTEPLYYPAGWWQGALSDPRDKGLR